jgi:3-deoxy-D-manno-octulosonic-acid transferase
VITTDGQGHKVINAVDIWWHAVSVGEMIASVPVITALKQQYPQLRIWITMSTPTGRDCLMARLPDMTHFSYAPMDHVWCVKRFLARVRPRLLVVMETEVWAEYLYQARAHQIPVVLANARLSERSRKGYARLGGFTEAVMQQIWRIKAQSSSDADRFLGLGCWADQVSVMGNLKFDLPEAKTLIAAGKKLRDSWARSQVWVAASTHEGEEAKVLAAHAIVRRTFPDALLILVPRHPDRFDVVAELLESQEVDFVRRTTNSPVLAQTSVYLGDTMGELLAVMAASDLAFIGGSLVPHGGHNFLEAILCGAPPLTGPHVHNFAHIHGLLTEVAGIRTVPSPQALAETLQALWQDAEACQQMLVAARKVLRENQGATQRLISTLEDALGLREARQQQRDAVLGGGSPESLRG